MSLPVTLERHGRIGVMRIDNPPVNALSGAVIDGIMAVSAEFEADSNLVALVVLGAGRTFVAGADIAGFERADFDIGPFIACMRRLEGQNRPVVAALHGTPLGGGLELALTCHYRVAHPKTRVGLPEVLLGLLPGALGTQRLPRVAGVEMALDMMLTGKQVPAPAALKAGIIDEIMDAEPLAAGLAVAQRLVDTGAALRRTGDIVIDPASVPEGFFEKALADATTRRAAYPAVERIVRCAQASLLPLDEGAAVEKKLFLELLHSPQSRALRHLFFAQRAATKIPGLPKDVTLRPVKTVGVVGAGTMGGGIAMNFANVGIPVVIVETTQAALDRGLGIVRANYEATAAKGRMTAEQVSERMGLLRGSLDLADLAGCDMVIEAVFENMELKKDVLARLGKVCKAGAIIASNTSTLDVDVLAQASGRAADVLGTHFFSPANVMKLLEIVRGKATAPDVLATVLSLASAIGKVPVVSGVCYGFIGNRMAEVYMRECEYLLMEGVPPSRIDRAVEALGLAMGPCRMLDMAGIDVGAKTVIERDKEGGLPPDASYRVVVRKMFELGRFGQKTGAGYYRYEGRKPVDDPETARICAELAAAHGIAQRAAEVTDQEIVERLLYTMVNEGALILEEGIAYRSGDIDIVWTNGYGFPDHKGGPMRMADEIGLAAVVARLDHHAATRGNAFGYWTVSALLREYAGQGKLLSDRPAAA